MSVPPPLPPEMPAHVPPPAGAAPAPPRQGRSGCAIAAIVLAVVGVVGLVVIGILAAIAIPQYQDYIKRTRVVGAAAAAGGVQFAIDEFQVEHNACPDAEAFAGLVGGDLDLGTGNASASASWEWVAPDDTGHCGFALRFSGVGPDVDDTTLGFRQHDDGDWTCDEGTLPAAYRRLSCTTLTIH